MVTKVKKIRPAAKITLPNESQNSDSNIVVSSEEMIGRTSHAPPYHFTAKTLMALLVNVSEADA